jgi:hypothetical protein
MNPETQHDAPPKVPTFEVIDSAELAKRWSVPESWVREQVRSRAADPLPCVQLGRYVRFEWNSPDLLRWWERRRRRQ